MVAILGWRQNLKRERAALAESVAAISEVASVPTVEVLRDFDAIQSFGTVPPESDVEADLSLLAALQ